MADPIGLLLADGHGAFGVWITRISHGVTIIAPTESARFHRAVYPKKRFDSDFSIDVSLTSYEKYSTFTNWMKEYAYKIANGSAKPMRVICPERNFDQTGVPKVVPFGDRAGQYNYPITLNFMTAQDPAGIEDPQAFSQAYGTTVDAEVNLMLPYGYQLTAWDPGALGPPVLPNFIDVWWNGDEEDD